MDKKTIYTLLFIIFSLAFSSLTLKAQDQMVTLSGNDITLKNAFEQIESQTNLSIDYDAKIIDVNQKIKSLPRPGKITAVLDALFKEVGYVYNFRDSHIIVTLASSIQTSTKNESGGKMNVSGVVVDEAGEPIIGATIQVVGETVGTITDFDGKFNIDVPADSELMISYIGYSTQTVKVQGKSELKILLEDNSIGLNEVVVVGYGSMQKKDLTGAVVSANIDAFKESPNVSLMQSLQGSVPGLNVGQVNEAGQEPSFTIRGQNTFNSGNTAPLLVVDGIIYQGSINDLNPLDIKSVDILKDASSASIYGSRAANGVILITTLSGEAKSAKPTITFSTSYSTMSPTNVLQPLNREQWLQRVKDAVWNKAYTEESGYLEANPNFDIESVWVANEIKEGYANGTDFNWWDAATQTGHVVNNFVSISGKNQGSTYYMSLGMTDQLGYIQNDAYKRYTGKINLENVVTKWLKIGVQSNVSFGNYDGMTPSMGDIMRMSPVTVPTAEDGTLLKLPMGQNVPNPFQPTEIDDLNRRMSLFGNLYADVDIPFIKGLSYRLNYSHNYRTAKRYQTDPNASNYQGSASKYNESEYDWTWDNILTYDRTFAKDHKLQVTLVAGREENSFESTNASNTVFSNLDLGYNKLSVGSNPAVSSTAWDETSLYYMGRIHYGYKRKYLGTFTIRRDGFSGFSEENKFGVFPSGAVAWVISEENFMKKKPLGIEYLKLRFSYGETGNRTAGRYATLAKVSAAASDGYIYGDNGTVTVGQYVTSIANNDLKWETTLGANLGLDFSFLKNRINGSVEVYNSNTSNILYQRNLPYASGFTSVTSNVGKINNKGVEFTLNTLNIDMKDFTWDMTCNFSLNRNKVLSIVGAWNDKDGDGIEDDQISDALFINEPLNVIYGYKITGLYQIGDENIPAGYRPGQYIVEKITDGDVVTAEDRQIIGYKDPSYRFSIANTFKYKNFSLFVFLNSIQGGKNRYMAQNDPGSSWGYNDASTNSNAVAWDYWSPSNPDARYSQLYYGTPNSPYRIQSRSFVRLQNVSLSYQFDKKLLEKVGIQSLKLYISGQNLFTWTNWEGWDPETGQGLIMNGSPVLRSFTAGLDISF